MTKPALWSCVDQETFQKMIEALESGDDNAQSVARCAKETYLLASVGDGIHIDPRDTRTEKQKAYDELNEDQQRLYDAFMECPETLAFVDYLLDRFLRPTFIDGLMLPYAIKEDRDKPLNEGVYQFPVWFPVAVFDELHRRNDTVELVRVLRRIISSVIDVAGLEKVRTAGLHHTSKPEGYTVDDFDPVRLTQSTS